MGPVEAVKTCLRKYATFSGRASRSEFWWFAGFSLTVGCIAGFFGSRAMAQNNNAIFALSYLLAISLVPPAVSAARRRQRDVNPYVPNNNFWMFFSPKRENFTWKNQVDVFRLFGCQSVALLLAGAPLYVLTATGNEARKSITLAAIMLVMFGWPLPNLTRPSSRETPYA